MRLRIMEFEGIVDLGELGEQTNREEGNWENMEVYGGGGEEAGSQQAQKRQRRGIFMRDNVALARCLFFFGDPIKSCLFIKI